MTITRFNGQKHLFCHVFFLHKNIHLNIRLMSIQKLPNAFAQNLNPTVICNGLNSYFLKKISDRNVMYALKN